MKYFFAFFFCISLSFAFTQNLVRNASFEDHLPISCLFCYRSNIDFAVAVESWKSFAGCVPYLCDSRYERNRGEERRAVCHLDEVKPYQGHSMVQMDYSPSCLDFQHQSRGCATYLATTLDAPLKIGKVYEVSFWLYILPEDVEYARHIGFSLYQHPIHHSSGAMLNGWEFMLDTVIYNEWYQAKWHVRPLCDLEYLVVGAFRGTEGPPVYYHKELDYPYYIDDIRVEEVTEPLEREGISATPFCRQKNKAQDEPAEAVSGADCLFNTGSSDLSPECRAVLDSFALRARQYPLTTFLIRGHTDSIGSSHEDLSAARAERVRAYLDTASGLPPLRFVCLAYGDTRPTASNGTATGRQQNRRVEIRQATFELASAIYRAALEYAFAGDMLATAKTLDKWLNVVGDSRKLLMLHDPRFSLLHGSPQWLRLEQKALKSYGVNRLGYALDSLWAEDQKHRTLQYYIENLSAYVDEVDKDDLRWVVNFPNLPDTAQAQRDEAHYQALQGIIAAHGWPRASEVGERPAKAAFLIVQHQSDTSALASALPLLRARCLEGEAEWIYYAAMYDRLQAMRDLPQRYGTQYRMAADGGQELYPLENRYKVNEWREELGLVPLEGLD